MRRSRHHNQKTASHGKIIDAIPISERRDCVEDRAVPGHWEGDLLFGEGKSQLATLVERPPRSVMLVKVDHKDTETVINALIKHAHALPQELYMSRTWDRGKEMAPCCIDRLNSPCNADIRPFIESDTARQPSHPQPAPV